MVTKHNAIFFNRRDRPLCDLVARLEPSCRLRRNFNESFPICSLHDNAKQLDFVRQHDGGAGGGGGGGGVVGIGAPQALPATADVSMTTARQYVRESTEARLIFFSDGTASGGTIRLTDRRQRIAIGVEWLTGAVHIERDAP
jgi:hypothetical protein